MILNLRQTAELQSWSLRAGLHGKCVYLNLSRRVPWFDELRRVGTESNIGCPEVSSPLITFRRFLGCFVWAVKYKNIAGLFCYSYFRISAIVYWTAPFFLAFGQTRSTHKLDPQTSNQLNLSSRRTTARQRPYRPSAKHISALTVCKTRVHIPAVLFISKNRLILKGCRTSRVCFLACSFIISKITLSVAAAKCPDEGECSQLLAINVDYS